MSKKKKEGKRWLTLSSGQPWVTEKFKEYYPKGTFSDEQLKLLFCHSGQNPDNRMLYQYHFSFHTNNMEVFDVFVAEIDRATEDITVLSAIPYEEIPFKRIMAFRRFIQQLPPDEERLDDGNYDEAEILKFME
ncbi:MAG: hypothetical protein LBU34_06460 [Planctomycetaceae bacterium]|jgi:hypothetical protein|nr:hypothetical protein [Planctomycetaceae bacterium]